ncbi:hypothetical protein GCM10009639_17760 [Kitasatospora putterlickiae]|uniref:DUF3592 domain-containing protein n=1 Tax=Kitasatospora putterlickiae TaxID=221725 RepID=A0ABN1XU38_9ACTN
MDWHGALVLWCAVWGVAALIWFGMSLAGVTGAQRTVRLTGRIERVRPPRHGGSRAGGISVVVSYRDPASGQDVTVTNDGEHGQMITAAWEGREIGVSHPRGRPHAYRLSNAPGPRTRGLGRAGCAAFLVYAGLVALTAIDRGWPWALIGSGGPAAVLGAVQLPRAVRDRNGRLARLSAMEAVPGRVVAVLRDVSVDQDDGHARTTITPVLSFTTRAGTVVTAHCTANLPDPAGAYGREVTVHYTAADPAEFTVDRAAGERSEKWDVILHVLAVAVFAAVAVAGAVLLRV